MTWHPDIPDEYRNQIVTGDARELAKRIPDESVDLIFTDPVYDRIDDYRWLAETAARVLKPDRAVLVWCGIGYLPETMRALNGHNLQYKWQLVAGRPKGFRSGFCMNRVFSNWQSLLWFEVGKSTPVETISDLVFSNNPGNMVFHEKWSKNINPYLHWLRRFTDIGAVIFDPFTGGGTVPAVCKMLQRNYIASEIDPDTADLARDRVRNTQPPLPLVMPVQGELL
jgi:methylase of polypeptide subunit release factors